MKPALFPILALAAVTISAQAAESIFECATSGSGNEGFRIHLLVTDTRQLTVQAFEGQTTTNLSRSYSAAQVPCAGGGREDLCFKGQTETTFGGELQFFALRITGTPAQNENKKGNSAFLSADALDIKNAPLVCESFN